ncbi:class I SAM-dependent methyltransferase [Sphingomonas sp. PR090111-T3T-6A]|uniref:class I SAM-dependent methyltransferase n=1 Tax=Sphingomonas sp. PR090111-T3T-6A TaxID=685778 RepID=UPI000367BE84|nr:methyltransferase domain-containing protein [Sphingomonas sp. PR090111-T3T-6A]
MVPQMETDQVANAYGRWAPVYDLVFGPVFRQGRRAAIDVAEQIGGRILEVGVGTGISLPGYDKANRITGVDISEPMLEKARQRVRALKLGHVEAIEVMDAENMDFPDNSFDVVVAQYVITSVPNPEKALDEFARVVRPGGEIVITTRVGAEQGIRGKIEKALMPVTSRLGFRTEFAFSRYSDWAEAMPEIELIERRELPPLGHFSLVRFRKMALAANDSINGAVRAPVNEVVQ